jgi:2'-5' RNA ligase
VRVHSFEQPAPAARESAILVPVPEAEQVVSRHRARLDRAAAWGVPAHVTVLYPFLAPSATTAAAMTMLADAVASVAAFDCRFGATGWFGPDVLWLAPWPAEPFRTLTRAVSAAFPGCPPYGGVYDDVVPHLTVGYRLAAGAAELEAAEAELLPDLPVLTHVSRVWLMTGTTAPGSWRTVSELPLAAG